MHRRFILVQFLAVGLFALKINDLPAAERERMTGDETELDSEPTLQQQRLIDQLTPGQVSQVDTELLANCATQWRKVARVVGTTMLQFNGRFRGIPDVFFAKRVALLVAAGKLEAQGNLKRMRFSEVRLPAK